MIGLLKGLEAKGVSHVVCHFDFASMQQAEIIRSMELFAEAVMPAFPTHDRLNHCQSLGDLRQCRANGGTRLTARRGDRPGRRLGANGIPVGPSASGAEGELPAALDRDEPTSQRWAGMAGWVEVTDPSPYPFGSVSDRRRTTTSSTGCLPSVGTGRDRDRRSIRSRSAAVGSSTRYSAC